MYELINDISSDPWSQDVFLAHLREAKLAHDLGVVLVGAKIVDQALGILRDIQE